MATSLPPCNSAAKRRRSESTISRASPLRPRRTLSTWCASLSGNRKVSPVSRVESTKMRVIGVRVILEPLPEDSPETVEKGTPASVVGLLSAHRLEPLQKLALLARQPRRHHHVHDDLEISTPPPPQARHPFALEPERHPRLYPRLYPHRGGPIEGRHLCLHPERRLDKADLHPVYEVLTVAYKLRIFYNPHAHVQVS